MFWQRGRVRLCLLLLGFFSGSARAIWGLKRHHGEGGSTAYSQTSTVAPSQAGEQRLSNFYAMALKELQELETEPLCHRIAARLLVNNCQLLEGHDEATVHTDSGRASRDFVDSYAASLAICDLERGDFVIPSSCSRFRESTLASIPVPAKPHLHVSTYEVDNCLKGLAQSDSAWNTWVSYRQKAWRFCQAARNDNEKTGHILLFRRVTRILEKLTTSIELEIEERLDSMNRMFQEATDSVESLAPHVDHLESRLRQVDEMIAGQLARTAQESNKIMESGLEHAGNLQDLLALLLKTAMDNAAEVANSHELALQAATHKVGDEIDAVLGVLSVAVSATVSLQDQIESSRVQAAEIIQNQNKIEAGMERLEDLATSLSTKYESHEGRLVQAQRKAGDILEILETATNSASKFNNAIFSGFGLAGWWPYFLCPAASLVMGSYGLEPSALRNIWLVGIGEAVGFLVSGANRYVDIFFRTSTLQAPTETPFNTTFDMRTLSNEIGAEKDFHKIIYAREI
ncbi:hypothetical protein G7046_g8550 [Stylonectria norvegica]|nr:hypothetical protein G7046_g8550 [Stylonectria norvegica]